MNKGKQVLIGILCEFDPGHEAFRRVLKGPETARQLMEATSLTKADLFSLTEDGATIFEYKQTWEHFDRLVDEVHKNGEEFTARDFTRVLNSSKSALDHAETLSVLPRLFTPQIWKGRLPEMEQLWYNVGTMNRRRHDFTEMRRRVAEAGNEKLREDQLELAGTSATDVRIALRNGRLEPIVRKLAEHNDHLRVADLLLLDGDGETAFHSDNAWRHFGEIVSELAKHGETLGADFFAHQRGRNPAILDKAIEHKALPQIFQADVWEGRAEEMMALFARIPEDKRGDLDINCVLVELADRKFGGKVTIDENLSRRKLTTAFNGAASDAQNSFIFRPLGLKAVWESMDDVRAQLRNNGEKFSLADLQQRSGTTGETCLRTAIRLGHFDDVIDILEESGETLSLADLKARPDERAKSILDLVIERSELPSLLRPSLWVGRSQDLVDLWKEVPQAARQGIDFQKIHGEVNRLSLRKKFGGDAPKPSM